MIKKFSIKIWHIVEIVVEFFVIVICRIIKKDYSKELFYTALQFVKFCMVGLSNTIINYLVYVIVISIGGHYLLANFFGFSISVMNAFLWSNKYVFDVSEGETRVWWKALIKTYVAYGVTGLGLNSALLYVLINVVGLSKMIAPVLLLIITIPLNFIINKFWSFKKEKK